jgi:multiple sugar transport system ATP-binding protein
VLHDAKLQQVGPPRELYERPANLFVAGFIGSPAMNLLPQNGKVAGFRPEHVDIAGDGEGIAARVEVVEDIGADAFVFCSADVDGEQTRLVARTDVRSAPQQGERVSLRPRSEEAHLFDAQSGERLTDS